MVKRILILGEGGIAGAFSAGFIYRLASKKRLDYFNEIYCYSVGTYPATFGVSGQYKTIRSVWKNKIDGLKLINPFNLLTFGLKKTLKLEYLENLFSSGEDKLDIKKVLNSRIKLKYALMDYSTGKVKFTSPSKNVLKQMSAACAVPVVHGSVKIENKKYIDPSFVCGTVHELKRITKKAEKIVYVSNFPVKYRKYNNSKINLFFSKKVFELIGKFYPSPLQEKFKKRFELIEKTIRYLEKEKKIKIVHPRKLYLKSARDTNRSKIIKLFKEGIKEADNFSKELNIY